MQGDNDPNRPIPGQPVPSREGNDAGQAGQNQGAGQNHVGKVRNPLDEQRQQGQQQPDDREPGQEPLQQGGWGRKSDDDSGQQQR